VSRVQSPIDSSSATVAQQHHVHIITMVRLISGLAYLALLGNTINAASLPESKNTVHILPEYANAAPRAAEIVSPDNTLERRKGGGGRGGGGGGSGGGRSGGGGGGGGSRTTPTSMTGGQTVAGSGPSRSFGRGGYYGGGAAVPYSAGSRTPRGLVAAPLLGGVALLAIMPGLWLYGSVYPYHYNNPYRFYNRSRNATENDNNNNNNNARSIVIRQSQQGANETLPVVCLCQEFAVCGCDENDSQAYIDDLIGNGSYAALNKSLVTVSEVNNTKTLVLNGTLPNGTTAPGGVDDAATGLSISQYSGYWAMGLVVLYGVML
jgi:hypothetical protein